MTTVLVEKTLDEEWLNATEIRRPEDGTDSR
jgi:hypothetical protein